MLQSMRSQRVGHNLVTEQEQPLEDLTVPWCLIQCPSSSLGGRVLMVVCYAYSPQTPWDNGAICRSLGLLRYPLKGP